jgi:hypothetical protein
MAFVGGNADYIHGKLYWAMSDDGVNWNIYGTSPTEVWKPLMEAKFNRDDTHPNSAPACGNPSGIGQVAMAAEGSYIYLFIQYYHPVLSGSYAALSNALSTMIFRFPYSSSHPWGFGSSTFQVYHGGSWQTSSGKLTWEYDDDAAGNQYPADTGNPVLNLYASGDAVGFQFGEGDIKYGNGKWLHVSGFGDASTPVRTKVQTATCLDPQVCGNWSATQSLDLSNIKAVYTTMIDRAPHGLYYGQLRKGDGTFTGTHWWLWTPAPTANHACFNSGVQSLYGGLSLIPSQLCTPDVPCGP